MGYGVEEDDLGGELTSSGDHRDRIDNRNGIEEGLDEDLPDAGDVAVFDVDRAEEKSHTEGEDVELQDGGDDEEPSGARGDAVDKRKDNNDDEVDKHIDDSCERGGDYNDVLGEADFAEEVAAIDDGLDAL